MYLMGSSMKAVSVFRLSTDNKEVCGIVEKTESVVIMEHFKIIT